MQDFFVRLLYMYRYTVIHHLCSYTSHELLSLTSQPIPFLILPIFPCASNRQISLLQLLLNNLPATNSDLTVNRCDSPVVHLDVRKCEQGLLILKNLGELLAPLG